MSVLWVPQRGRVLKEGRLSVTQHSEYFLGEVASQLGLKGQEGENLGGEGRGGGTKA